MLRRVILVGFGAVGLLLTAFGIWVYSLPSGRVAAAAPPIAQDEIDAALAGLRPVKRARPLIAIIGINDATETTDYLMPYGILRRADIADVMTVATGPGPVSLYPALKVEPDTTVVEFETRYPDGADYVIVPAMSRDDDPAALAFLKDQAAKGATIIGICVGVKVVAAAGLLDNKRTTTHWYVLKEMLEKHPTIHYVADRRLVVDAGVATTTGITASMPAMLTLIEAIAGREKAQEVARDLGLVQWDVRHDSGAFEFTRQFAATVLGNVLRFWNRDQLGIELEPGIDEVSLALVADAWSRTYRSHATTFAASNEPVKTREGMRIWPDRVATAWAADRLIPAIAELRPAEALDQTLESIARRYGADTAQVVAMQLEYPRLNVQR